MKKIVFFLTLIVLLSFAFSVEADSVSEKRSFFVDTSYDLTSREKLEAILVKVSSNLYFYIDAEWWSFTPQGKVYQSLTEIEQEFNDNIYPVLTSTFGPERKPGIDKDERITVLIHPMKEGSGGYFRSNDEYSKVQVSDSNEREMVYLNSDYITDPIVKSFLAHEFVHLITFNQKENNYGLTEDVWLNEARAEYAPTLLGLDDDFEGSNLQRRTEAFSDNPSDSIIEWSSDKKDYGSINLFTQYLVDHYGIEILVDSLQSSKTGIDSLNYALEMQGYEERLSDIFFDWTIAVLINDCTYGDKYCYLNPNLDDFHVSSKINFLPLSGESSLSYTDFTRKWRGNWYKIIGGNSNLKVSFECRSGTDFHVPYITQNQAGSYKINFLELNECSGKLTIEDFGQEVTALYLIPSSADSSDTAFYPFSWTVSIERTQDDTALIQKLLNQIVYLKAEIARVQARIAAILGQRQTIVPQPVSACFITNNLSQGMSNQQVSCLQNFLKSEGVYPEGLITGYFGKLTKAAVIRFQEKYASEILSPLGLLEGTGYVGPATRAKINEIL